VPYEEVEVATDGLLEPVEYGQGGVGRIKRRHHGAKVASQLDHQSRLGLGLEVVKLGQETAGLVQPTASRKVRNAVAQGVPTVLFIFLPFAKNLFDLSYTRFAQHLTAYMVHQTLVPGLEAATAAIKQPLTHFVKTIAAIIQEGGPAGGMGQACQLLQAQRGSGQA
jgi:hypothetical protein